MKRITFALLLIAMLAGCMSCGSGESDTDTTVGDTTETPTTTEEAYKYPDLNLGGEDLTILNATTTWGFYTTIDLEEATGDTLDDVIFERNRDMEDRFNFKFNVIEDNLDKTTGILTTSILAGDDTYDLAYLRADTLSSPVSEGMFTDLNSLDALQLTEDWWIQSIREEGALGADEKLYFAGNYFSLMGFDGTVCTFFNESMMEDLKLDKPYDLVREGKWTVDEFYKYMQAGAALNGDESFTFDVNGSSTYGLATWLEGLHALYVGCGMRYVQRGDDGIHELAVGGNKFYDVTEKLAKMCEKEGEYIFANSGDCHYEKMFAQSRNLLLVAELKASSKYRDFNDNFGIVPMPKYDESQEYYQSYTGAVQSLMVIPVTNSDPDTTAAVIDALAYVSYRDVLPIYYDVNVSQKGLRNDDSIEMLDIIRESRFFDVGGVLGWTRAKSGIYAGIQSYINGDVGELASTLAAEMPRAEAAIKETMDMVNGN